MADLFSIISTRMNADTGAGGLNEPVEGAVGGFHRNQAPEGTPYNRIHVKLVTGLPTYTMTAEYARERFVQFTVFTKDPQGHPDESTEPGGKKALRLSERVQSLFFDADVLAGDSTFIGSRLERELSSTSEEDEANGQTIYSEGCILAMWTA
jgi:hypothetical protein